VHLRISERLWERARDAERLAVDLQAYLNKHEEYLWWQPARYHRSDESWHLGVARPVMRSLEKDADLKVVLRPSTRSGIDYTVIALRRSNDAERFEAVGGRNLKGETFRVLRPTDNIENVVVVIKPSYNELPEYLKTPIRYSWDRLVYGMEQRKIRMGDDTVFLLTGTPDHLWMTELSEALGNADQVGRLTCDPWEVKRARELTEKYGQKCGH